MDAPPDWVPMEKPSRIVIFANGLVPDPDRVRPLLKPGDTIVCADGGTRLALALGRVPHVVIGDLDSIAGADRATIESSGIPVRQYPHDKDQTDLELALTFSLERAPSAILIIGALGGRLDHTLANLSLLSDGRLRGIDCLIDDGVEQVAVCRDHLVIEGRPGDLVSLLPWGVPATGVRTAGLRWQLSSEVLYPDHARGVSNEMIASNAAVDIDSGLLLIVHSRVSQLV